MGAKLNTGGGVNRAIPPSSKKSEGPSPTNPVERDKLNEYVRGDREVKEGPSCGDVNGSSKESKKVHHVKTSMGRQRSQRRSITWRCQWVVKGVKGRSSCGDVNGSSKESKKVHHRKTSMDRQSVVKVDKKVFIKIFFKKSIKKIFFEKKY